MCGLFLAKRDRRPETSAGNSKGEHPIMEKLWLESRGFFGSCLSD